MKRHTFRTLALLGLTSTSTLAAEKATNHYTYFATHSAIASYGYGN